jgi:hypothetical protein
MKAEPLKTDPDGNGYKRCPPEEATHLRLHLPGPLENRILPVMIGGTRKGTNNWTWNGSVDSPTVKPSILTKGSTGFTSENGERTITEHVCHSFVNDGMVQFLSDCTHEYANQTLPLLDIT